MILSKLNISSLSKNAIDIHCHGVGRFDFTEISDIDLQTIEAILAARKHHAILTLYLPKENFDQFLRFMESFSQGKKSNKFTYIEGIALEGPLLASHGGTPHKGVWSPSKKHWQQIAECGMRGLVYTIFSPDADLDKQGSSSIDTPATSTSWIAETLLAGGVLPAAGHFTKHNPEYSAQQLQKIYDVIAYWNQSATVSDHLYNDMPHNFKHAWRTPTERLQRKQQINELKINSWSLKNLDEKLGIVPSTMIRNAKKGLVKIALNFDGEHVDLEIVKKTVELIGSENILMMTDSIESKRLAGRTLTQHEGSTLLYQDENIVAAGSQNIDQQIENMLLIGLSNEQIKQITKFNPQKILNDRLSYIDKKVEPIDI